MVGNHANLFNVEAFSRIVHGPPYKVCSPLPVHGMMHKRDYSQYSCPRMCVGYTVSDAKDTVGYSVCECIEYQVLHICNLVVCVKFSIYSNLPLSDTRVGYRNSLNSTVCQGLKQA